MWVLKYLYLSSYPSPTKFAHDPKSAIEMNETRTYYNSITVSQPFGYQEGTSRNIDAVRHMVCLCVAVCKPFLVTLHNAWKELGEEWKKKKRCKKLAKGENVYNIVFIYCLVPFRFHRRQFTQFAHRECAVCTPLCARSQEMWWGQKRCRYGLETKFCFYFEISLLLYSFYSGWRARKIFAPNYTSFTICRMPSYDHTVVCTHLFQLICTMFGL